MEQVDAHRAVLAAHVSRVGPPAAHTWRVCDPDLFAKALSMAETGAVAAASSKRNSALLKPCEPMAADGGP